mmetsp:Transcript_790/g.1063  ORF Transcript_790/g.1063 Transcript_790/m.1063 type:complete len:168 (+) Transcript_790:24-527(+)
MELPRECTSILRLKSKVSHPGFHNKTTFDREYEKEQDRLNTKRALRADLETHRSKAIFGSKEDKQELQEMQRSYMEKQLALRAQAQENVKQEDLAYQHMAKQADQYYSTVEERRMMAKREYERRIFAENQQLRAQRFERDRAFMEEERRLGAVDPNSWEQRLGRHAF